MTTQFGNERVKIKKRDCKGEQGKKIDARMIKWGARETSTAKRCRGLSRIWSRYEWNANRGW